MPWVRLDEQFPDHPKIMAAGPLAGWLHVCALAYCNRLLTDGFVPAAQVPKLADFDGIWTDPDGAAAQEGVYPLDLAKTLVEAGMWVTVKGGFRIHDYHDFQPSKADVLTDRAAKAAAGRKGGMASAAARAGAKNEADAQTPAQADAQAPACPSVADPFEAEGQAGAQRSGKQNPSPTRPVTDTDLLSQNRVPPAATSLVFPDAFEVFWWAYPRRESKGRARKAWTKAVLKADPETIIAGARRHAHDPNREAKYTRHPESWLNGECWLDEPKPSIAAISQGQSALMRAAARHAQ